MRTKLKIALCILIAITAILLIVTYAMIFTSVSGLDVTEPEQDTETDPNEALGIALSLTITLVFNIILGVTWLVTALMLLIFVPIIASAKTDGKMHKALKALLICTIIFSVACGISMLISLIMSVSLISYFVPLLVAMALAGVCLLATFITVIVSYAKFNKYYVSLPTEQPIAEQTAAE